MQSGEGLHCELRLCGRAACDLVALNRGRHIGEKEDDVRAVLGDLGVIATRNGDCHLVGDPRVELDLRAVTECHPLADRVVLCTEFDRE